MYSHTMITNAGASTNNRGRSSKVSTFCFNSSRQRPVMPTQSFNKNKYSKLLIQALPRVIETKKQHREALELAVSLIDKGTKRSPEETAILTLISILIEHYETNKILASSKSTGLDALKHLMEANSHSAKDLWKLADKAVVSKILAGERAISKNVARSLASFYSVPVSIFI